MLPYNNDTLHIYGAISAGKHADITKNEGTRTRNSFNRLKAHCSICIGFEVAVDKPIYTFQTKEKKHPSTLHV